MSNNSSNSSVVTGECSTAISYSGSVCRECLLSATGCDSTLPDPLVLRDASQEAMTLLGLLSSASPECADASKPLLCLYIFRGVCDEEGTLYQPTLGLCMAISTGVCQSDFDLARRFQIELPDCSLLPESRPMGNCNESDGSGAMSSCEYVNHKLESAI